MQFALTEDQNMLAQTANGFVGENSPITRLRKLRDAGAGLGYEKAMLQRMAELGWTAIPFAEDDGGLGMGMAEAILVTEAMGRTLCPEPVLASAFTAGQALSLGGTAATKEAWLGPVMEGQKVVALAYLEPGMRFDARDIACTAVADGDGFKLTGKKALVLGGAEADAYVVAARTSHAAGEAEGLTLFLVPADASGVQSKALSLVDSRNAAALNLEGVSVGADAVLGKVGQGFGLLDDVLDRATVALCGEMLGAADAAFKMTLEYLKERKQFDTVIGTFQALQHRAGNMFVELELSRSAVMAAARAVDAGQEDAKALVSNAKARVSDTFVLVANEAVQMHGGIGMTDEHDIGFYMKRARAAEMTFGDAAYHRDRFATLNDF